MATKGTPTCSVCGEVIREATYKVLATVSRTRVEVPARRGSRWHRARAAHTKTRMKHTVDKHLHNSCAVNSLRNSDDLLEVLREKSRKTLQERRRAA